MYVEEERNMPPRPGPLRMMETEALDDAERGLGRATVEDRCRSLWLPMAAPEVDKAGLVLASRSTRSPSNTEVARLGHPFGVPRYRSV